MSGGRRVVVLDYGSGNLRSACRALERAGAEVVLSADVATAERADGLVVPGVGAYAACMAGLRGIGGDDAIRARAAAGRPVLGICVGYQVLFDEGVEHGVQSAGCGVLPGRVERLAARRLPHMGWNLVDAPAGSVLFDRVADQRFYFVHSYGVHTTGADHTTWCDHEADRFVAAVEHGAVSGTQFHPEKSGGAGLRLLGNWVASLGR
ncbi:imidazole glycerol phosphate synthase subunit HisH [Granulicoccus sp. GXG6511]|uniref:imidazole glycerol phosphate synthase subunit HisH n=1 Tax=Granulicoccus sp. GXG6511 TaxID=3381351 RepID=UPI003D7EA1BF